MTDLEFLQGEAALASASLPQDSNIQIVDVGNNQFDVNINEALIAGRLSKDAALACIMGIGGAFAYMSEAEG